jgi:hypothetical protein
VAVDQLYLEISDTLPVRGIWKSYPPIIRSVRSQTIGRAEEA